MIIGPTPFSYPPVITNVWNLHCQRYLKPLLITHWANLSVLYTSVKQKGPSLGLAQFDPYGRSSNIDVCKFHVGIVHFISSRCFSSRYWMNQSFGPNLAVTEIRSTHVDSPFAWVYFARAHVVTVLSPSARYRLGLCSPIYCTSYIN